jgi:hypothetical protein
MAIAPLAVYYSQETRGYMLLTALILIATLAALHLINGDHRKRIWFAYIASMALALYTHYFAAFAWVAINAGVIVALIIHPHPGPLPHREREYDTTLAPEGRGQGEGRWRQLAFWVLAQFIILACFLPYQTPLTFPVA